jgi:glutathione S-transferase
MFVLGPQTNARWLHGIRQDKRDDSLRSEDELAFNGERISLTFRNIGTYLDRDSRLIWGQGATCKDDSSPKQVINGHTPEADAMIQAMGSENQQSDFDWPAQYGQGFDVLNMTDPTVPPRLPQLHLSGDAISDLQVQLLLTEADVAYDVVERDAADGRPRDERALRLVDNDDAVTVVEGGVAILVYVETYYRQNGAFGSLHSRFETGTVVSRIGQGRELYGRWKHRDVDDEHAKAFKNCLASWEERAAKNIFIGGPSFSVADCVFWPLLDDIVTGWTGWVADDYPHLGGYHSKVGGRASVNDLPTKEQWSGKKADDEGLHIEGDNGVRIATN